MSLGDYMKSRKSSHAISNSGNDKYNSTAHTALNANATVPEAAEESGESGNATADETMISEESDLMGSVTGDISIPGIMTTFSPSSTPPTGAIVDDMISNPPKSLARQVLGSLVDQPAIRQLLAQAPHIGINELNGVQEVIKINPAAAQDFSALMQVLNIGKEAHVDHAGGA